MANPTGQNTNQTKPAPPKVDQPARDFVPSEKDQKNTGKDGASESKTATGTTAPIPEAKKL